MEQNSFPRGKAVRAEDEIQYQASSVVSKTIIKKEKGNVSIFAFDKGEALSEHAAPFDALLCVTDGKAEIVIGGNPNIVSAGEMIIMPANIPHAVNAIEKFKMMLIMIKA